MPPFMRREGDKKEIVWDWESHIDRMIREAKERGEFDNLPGMGKPLDLEENVFAGEMSAAYRMVKNANAAPLWILLDKEIQADVEALAALLDRTAARLAGTTWRGGSAAQREAERQRARGTYLEHAAGLDKKIEQYNAERPRHLTWLEKVRLTPAQAGKRFDDRVPPSSA